jgi:hypothetical protein
MSEPIKLARPNPDTDKVGRYRLQAARCRAVAAQTPHLDIKEGCLTLARQWEDLARSATATFTLPNGPRPAP